MTPWDEKSWKMLKDRVGDDRRTGPGQDNNELYSFKCPVCGFTDIRGVKALTCGCGEYLKGTLVYKRIGKTVVLDKRFK